MRIDRVVFFRDRGLYLLRFVHEIEIGSLLLGHDFGLNILGFWLLGDAGQSGLSIKKCEVITLVGSAVKTACANCFLELPVCWEMSLVSSRPNLR